MLVFKGDARTTIDIPTNMLNVVVGVIEDEVNDEEFETAYSADQKDALRAFLDGVGKGDKK